MQPIPSQPQQYRMRFHGDGLGLALIVLKNMLLTIVTLGIYGCWGKVNVRRFLWHSSELHGQRFGYHGTGGELLRGYAKVALLYASMVGLFRVSMRLGPIGHIIPIAIALGFGALIPYAIYSSQRYLASRTSWRGIRFGMVPGAGEFVKTFLHGYLLTVITLGFYAPIWQNRLYAIRINNSRYGTLSLRYTGTDKEAFSLFIKALPLIIVTLGIYFIWYRSIVSRFRAGHTWIGNAQLGAARGHLQFTGGEYFGLMMVNLLCVVFTLGLAMPWVIAHNMAFFLGRFSFVGQVDFDRVEKVQTSGNAAGDGLADVLNVGFGV